jgi:hypothetical protein
VNTSTEDASTWLASVPASIMPATHVFVVALHTGVAPLHCAFDVHCSHSPALAPVLAQTPDTQARVPSAVVHVRPGSD